MAKVLKRRLRWNPATTEDAANYRVYYLVGGGEIDYASTPFKDFPLGVQQAIIPDDIPELALVDGDVTIGVAIVDDVGNESDVVAYTRPFDFAAPDAPTGVVIEAFAG